MARYDAPPDPYEQFSVDCLRVYYPDSPLLFRALRAQLTYLESRFVWETDGDIVAAEKLEQDWLSAGKLTFDGIGTGCPDVDECEQIIIDLTLQLEQCQEQLEEYENMNITVNCNCCCDGTGFPNHTDGDGNPLPCVPLQPDDPFGDNIPTWDDNNEVPPPTYPDYPSWVNDRCRASNYLVDSYIEMVENLDLAERRLSAGGAILEVAAVILAALPGPVGDWLGAAVIIKWLIVIVNAIAESAEALEDLGDWLQLSVDEIEQNKAELVCALYQMTSPQWFAEFLLTFFAGHISPSLVAAGASTAVVDFMRTILTDPATWLASRMADAVANTKIPAGYIPTVDCATCGQVAGFEYVPLTILTAVNSSGTGVSNVVSNIVDAGARLEATMTANAAGRNIAFNLTLSQVPVQASQIVGLAFRIEHVNGGQSRINDFGGTNGKWWDGGLVWVNRGNVHWVRSVIAAYPLSIPGVQHVGKSNAIAGQSCTLAVDGIQLGFASAGALDCSLVISDVYAIVETARAC